MRRALLAVLVAAGATVTWAVPAHAGGPTSVILASPTQQTAAALYYADPRYAELDALLHGADAAAEETEAQPGAGTQLNVTWLIHDVSVWRVDSLVLDAAGEAWISTQQWDGVGDAAGGGWTRLRQPEPVRDLVASLGLLGGDAARASGTQAGTTPASRAPTAAPDPAPPVVREETRWFSLAGWRWAVPGVVAGLLGAWVALRRRPGPAAPRQELIDVPAERVTAPG